MLLRDWQSSCKRFFFYPLVGISSSVCGSADSNSGDGKKNSKNSQINISNHICNIIHIFFFLFICSTAWRRVILSHSSIMCSHMLGSDRTIFLSPWDSRCLRLGNDRVKLSINTAFKASTVTLLRNFTDCTWVLDQSPPDYVIWWHYRKAEKCSMLCKCPLMQFEWPPGES